MENLEIKQTIRWEDAYANTSKIAFGVGRKIVCKKCDKITETKSTRQRQIIGNCHQFIVECKNCNSHFVDQN